MKYLFLSLLSGMLLALAWPVHGFPLLIFFGFVPLLLAEHSIGHFSKIKYKGWAVFGLSYLSFFLWNILTTWWLYNALNPDGSHSLVSVLFPNLVNPLLMTIVFMLYYAFKKRTGTYFGLVFFIVAWICFEKFHLEWELSWPWLNLGNVFAHWHWAVQWYDATGVFGGTLWILVVNVLVFYTVRIWQAGKKRKELYKNVFFTGLLIALPIIISLLKYNNYKLKSDGKVNVCLLQPDVDPYNEKYAVDSLTQESNLLAEAEKNTKGKKIDFFVAPETAIPGSGNLSENGFQGSILIKRLDDFLVKYPHSVFLSGASTYKVYKNEAEKSETAFLNPNYNVWMDYYNSAIQVIPKQKTEVYHKGKLVPGPEIFPYMRYLKPILGNVMLDYGGIVINLGVDRERKAFANPYNKAKVAPIICYESIYGEYVTEYVKNGANILSIMTNDSWWGYSPGHKQLLEYAKLRAIETRKDIVRSANSGVSAYINQKGDIVESYPYGAKGALIVQANLVNGETTYVKYGDYIYRIALFIFGFLIIYYWAQIILGKKSNKLVR